MTRLTLAGCSLWMLAAVAFAPAQEPATESTTTDGRTKRTLKLPAAAEHIVLAGSGRYLLAHLKSLQKLAVIDVKEAKVAKYISAPEGALFAGGAEKLFIVAPGDAVIQRWNLATLEREVAAPLPTGTEAGTLTMGHASLGPLLIGSRREDFGGRGFTLLDAKTLQPLPLPKPEGHGFECYAGCVVRASASGQVFTSYRTHVSPAGFYTLVLSGNSSETFYEHSSFGHLLPSPDGSRIYASRGVFNNKTRPLGPENREDEAAEQLPAATGDCTLRIHRAGDSTYTRQKKKSQTRSTASAARI